MLLNEVFDQPYRWKTISDGKWQYSAGFQVEDGAVYMVSGYLQDVNKKPTWEFGFTRMKRGEDTSYKVTNTGNQQHIFATIVDIFRTFIADRNPDRIAFDAIEPNRKKLYIRMVKQLLPNWNVAIEANTITITNPGVV